MSDKVLLSIMMLVSNSKEKVLRAIDSLSPIRDRITTEVILVDTGCSDELHEELVRRGDKVVRFEWCNDFAKARNAGLAHATGEWFMFLDDDEFFEDVDDLILLFTSGVYHKFGFASYVVRNYLDKAGNTYSDAHVSRMARLTSSLCFEGRIHEYMTGKEGEGIRLKSRVGHFGYVFGSQEARRKHFLRNASLIEEMIQEEPDNVHWGEQLIQEYRAIEEFQSMIPCAASYLNKSMKQQKYDVAGTFYLGLIMAYKGLEQYDIAQQWAEITIADQKTSRMCRAFAHQLSAYILFELGEFKKSLEQINVYFEEYEFFMSHNSELVSQMETIFVSEAFNKRRLEESYSILICCNLLSGSTRELELYMKELHWNTDSVYVYEHMAEVLILAMNELTPCEAFYDVARLIWNKSILKNYFISQINLYSEREQIDRAIAIFQKIDKESLMNNGE